MIRTGITGINGFIGSNLRRYLAYFGEGIEIVEFSRDWFDQPDRMDAFLASCDVVVHLAAVNRHPDPGFVEHRNLEISERLLEALERTGHTPDLIFASSTQEDRDTPYARAKRRSRKILAEWARQKGAGFTGLIIPNVFGPLGEPYRHSVVTTFCHQLHTGENPEIIVDAEVSFISVMEVVRVLHAAILSPFRDDEYRLPVMQTIQVSGLLDRLREYHEAYIGRFEIPALHSAFDLELFNTYRSFLPPSAYPFFLKVYSDARGSLAEVVRAGGQGQVFYSVTLPGITRGNHFHLRKVERFCVLKGRAEIRLRRIDSDEVTCIEVSGERPSVVDMPVWYTHSITNTGNEELLTLFWSSEFYDPEDADTWQLKV
jgi:UDP-2-acetamido-2,6-beta-L-arabino-hexul-4-ose reductase